MQQFDFEEAIKAHLKRADLSQAAAARRLHYTPEQFNKWIRGVNRIPDVAIQELADLLHLTDEERRDLFRLAGYVAVTAPQKELDAIPVGFDYKFFLNALKSWNNLFFRWPEAPPHLGSSWAGMVIHAMSAVTSHITPRGFLVFCITLLLGIVTAQLMTPVLQWPLDDVEARGIAYLKYGLATLIIPLIVAIATSPEQPGLFQLENISQRMTFWFLKFTGALAGFWVFSSIVLGLAITCYFNSVYPPNLTTGKTRW